MTLDGDTPLSEVIEWLHERIEEGVVCPACDQFAKVYKRRTISGRMACDMISAYRAVGALEWFHLPDYDTSRETSKLAYWGLIEEKPGMRDDGSRHAGWWRITTAGQMFIRNKRVVPKRAVVYNGKLLTLDASEFVSVTDVLGSKFNYGELMWED